MCTDDVNVDVFHIEKRILDTQYVYYLHKICIIYTTIMECVYTIYRTDDTEI